MIITVLNNLFENFVEMLVCSFLALDFNVFPAKVQATRLPTKSSVIFFVSVNF